MRIVHRALAVVALSALPLIASTATAATAASAATVDCTTGAAVTKASYQITHLDGSGVTVSELGNYQIGTVRAGDVIVGSFKVSPACTSVVLSGASYIAPSEIFSTANQRAQVLFDSVTKTGAAGQTVLLTLRVPTYALPAAPGACPNPHNSSPQAGNGNGSTDASNPYASTCDGTPSANGNGKGTAGGKPCAGCVGNADNKNPPGQQPNGTDPNNGYECDGNSGVGKGNPAHSGCRTKAHFQVDFVVGQVIKQFYVDKANPYYLPSRFLPGGSTLG